MGNPKSVASPQGVASFIFIVTFLFSVETLGRGQSCVGLFRQTPPVRLMSYYAKQIDVDASRAREPKYLDPKEELERASLWHGTKNVPKSVRDTLLRSTAVLDFQLLASDMGAVKVGEPGTFVSLRLNEQWQGRDYSTNIGLPIDALLTRTVQGNKEHLVPETAKAVMIFMHGGGTKTTGHHVAKDLANFLSPRGVVVLSMDAPMHAYGPRMTDLNPYDYYRYLVHFRNTHIPKNVPVFIGGHSMGGLHADNMMRLSDNPEFGIKEAFAGLVSLSTPLDSAPGRPRSEKDAVEKAILENEKLMELVPEAERDLNVELLINGKISPLSGVSAEMFMSIVNWKKPEHGGQDYLPTLAVMGERDALYIGREQVYQEYIADLKNVESHLMGERVNHKGRTVWVSHMIFDHYRGDGKTHEPEVFHLIKEFIEKQLGQPLDRLGKNPLFQTENNPHLGQIAPVIQEYYNNLAFRNFAQQFEIMELVAKPRIVELGPEMGQLTKEAKALEKEIAKLQKADPNNELEAKLAEMEELQAKRNEIHHLQKSTFIPKDPELAAWAQSNIARRQQIEAELTELNHQRKTLNQELRELREERNHRVAEFDRLVKAIFEDGSTTNSAAVKQALQDYERTLDVMIERQIKMNEANSQMVEESAARGDYRIDPSPETLQLYRELDQAYAAYNRADKAVTEAITLSLARGEGTPEAKALFENIYGSLEGFRTGEGTPESLIGRVETVRSQTLALEWSFAALKVEHNSLLESYIKQVTPDLYEVHRSTLAQELDRPLTDVLSHNSRIQKFWQVWDEMWKLRPPDQATSLY